MISGEREKKLKIHNAIAGNTNKYSLWIILVMLNLYCLRKQVILKKSKLLSKCRFKFWP